MKVVGLFLDFFGVPATLFLGEGEKRMKNMHHKEHEAGRNLWLLQVIFHQEKLTRRETAVKLLQS